MPKWLLTGSELVEDVEDAVPEADSFDPSDHNIDEVKQYINDHPDEVQRVYDAEVEGKGRSSLLDWLSGS